VVTDTGGVTTTVHVGGYFEWVNGSSARQLLLPRRKARGHAPGGELRLTFIASDHLGSTSVLADASGNLVARLRYDAWGVTRYSEGTLSTDYQFHRPALPGYTGPVRLWRAFL
jgi:hypothetical protein